MLLGEVWKPEAATNITFGNAVSRLVEMGCLERRTRKSERDRWIRRGERFGELERISQRIGGALLVARDRGGAQFAPERLPDRRSEAAN